ncbi:hypothetical protein KQX54_019133 [Cotesia glomerata]|uniref:Uncharacterized protein n=1 Tax=Cotesia glomerata TaxID=32391 RepID=A0AAV7IS04_COTGL|nr:hypothetical protein KQX54_019133 [Cotesia glomerata]
MVNGTSTYITSYPNLTQIFQPEYPPLPANNNCIYVGTSTSFDLNTGPNDHTDQQYYEFPSTAKPRPDCQVIEMKKIDESIYTQNIPINTKQYELKDRNKTLTDVQNSDSLKTCSNSKVAPEMTNLLSALIPETKGFMISRDYLKNGVNKVELPQKSGFYLAKDVFLNIQEEAGNDWTKIVSETINEVYSTEIKNFSARGRYSAGRSKINPKLFKGLLNESFSQFVFRVFFMSVKETFHRPGSYPSGSHKASSFVENPRSTSPSAILDSDPESVCDTSNFSVPQGIFVYDSSEEYCESDTLEDSDTELSDDFADSDDDSNNYVEGEMNVNLETTFNDNQNTCIDEARQLSNTISDRWWALVKWIGGEDDKKMTSGIVIRHIKDFDVNNFLDENHDPKTVYVIEWRDTVKEPLCDWKCYNAIIVDISHSIPALEKKLEALEDIKSPGPSPKPESLLIQISDE